MMTATEILELADEGEIIRWSRNYASKVCAAHGLDIADYFAERASNTMPAQIVASSLLGWMGY